MNNSRCSSNSSLSTVLWRLVLRDCAWHTPPRPLSRELFAVDLEGDVDAHVRDRAWPQLEHPPKARQAVMNSKTGSCIPAPGQQVLLLGPLSGASASRHADADAEVAALALLHVVIAIRSIG